MTAPDLARVVPATRRSLARRWLVVVALVVLVIAMFGTAGWVAMQDARSVELQRQGEQADGTVVAVDAQAVGRGNTPNGSVIVSFEVDGRSQDSSIYVGGGVVDHQQGQAVTVVYEETDPTRVEILGEPSRGPGVPLVPPLLAGAVFAGMAVVAGRHAWQIRRALGREPWLVVPSRLVQVAQSVAMRQGSRLLVVLETTEGEIVVEPLGFGRVDPTFEPEAWVAGLDRRTMALAAPGGGHVISVRLRSSGRSARGRGRRRSA